MKQYTIDNLLKVAKKGQKKKAKEYSVLFKDTPKKIQKRIIKKRDVNKLIFGL